MNVDAQQVKRLLEALAGATPVQTAREHAEVLKAEGMGALEMYRLYDRVREQLEDGDPRYDAVLDTMDCIRGWCSNRLRLFGTCLSNDPTASDRAKGVVPRGVGVRPDDPSGRRGEGREHRRVRPGR